MAAPAVTGAVALLSDAYGVSGIEDLEEQVQAMYEIRARLAGGVTRTEGIVGYLRCREDI